LDYPAKEEGVTTKQIALDMKIFRRRVDNFRECIDGYLGMGMKLFMTVPFVLRLAGLASAQCAKNTLPFLPYIHQTCCVDLFNSPHDSTQSHYPNRFGTLAYSALI